MFPYRSKNPPERFPYATITLIVLNVLVYLVTTHAGVVIKNGVVTDFAVSPAHIDPWRLFASMFLHANLMHILGNMVFLWVFGASLEGRLRIPWFLTLYFVAGFAGGLAQMVWELARHNDAPVIGASGAIMGVAGAYMYVFPFARIMMFRFRMSFGSLPTLRAEWLAWWVVGYYIAINILEAMMTQSSRHTGGTAYFDHFGGFAVGLLMVMALKTRRDSEQISDVQATRVNLNNDLKLMSASELETILEAPTENMDMVLIYCNKALGLPGDTGEKKTLKMIERYKEDLLLRADPEMIASTLLKIPKDSGGVAGTFYLKLGSRLEGIQKYDTAAYIYRRIFDIDPYSPDSNAAILRFGRIWETIYHDVDMARDAYEVYIKLFPKGPLIEEAEKGLVRVGGPKVVAPIIRQTTIKKMNLADEDSEKAPMYATAFPAESVHDLQADQTVQPSRIRTTQPITPKADASRDTTHLTVPNPFADE